MMRRLRLKVRGFVQGVNFRHYAKQEAIRLGLVGFVRNLPDGAVECVAEGEEENLKQLAQWCERGPRRAAVEKCEANWERATAEFHSFEIQSSSWW